MIGPTERYRTCSLLWDALIAVIAPECILIGKRHVPERERRIQDTERGHVRLRP
jgi:hypothetical protein